MVVYEWMVSSWYGLYSSTIVSNQQLIQLIIVVTCIILIALIYVGIRLYQTNQKKNRPKLLERANIQQTDYKKPPNDHD